MSLVGLNPRESCISSAHCVELSFAPELSVACGDAVQGAPWSCPLRRSGSPGRLKIPQDSVQVLSQNQSLRFRCSPTFNITEELMIDEVMIIYFRTYVYNINSYGYINNVNFNLYGPFGPNRSGPRAAHLLHISNLNTLYYK